MSTFRYVGADGCKGGAWACVWIDGSGSAGFEVVENTPALLERFGDAERILLDVPIGLSPTPTWRACDLEAKRVLGRANSRVFLTPPRAVLDCGTWAEANRRSRETSGKGLSKQAWMITPRIREVDACMRTSVLAREIVRECHPEVCVWGLCGAESGGVVGPPKKTEEGAAFRLELIEPFIPESRTIVERTMAAWRRSELAKDDVIDALIAAATAAGHAHQLRTLPARPECDDHGIAMEMVYRRAGQRPEQG